jgi:hypothetical protein
LKTNLDIFDDEIAGGPALPCLEIRTHDTGDIVQNADQGISKRDFFAAQVDGRMSIRTALAIMNATVVPVGEIEAALWWAEAEARIRYMRADAMMKVRAL